MNTLYTVLHYLSALSPPNPLSILYASCIYHVVFHVCIVYIYCMYAVYIYHMYASMLILIRV